VMQSPGLLLADEPTSSLDPKTSVEIMEVLRDLAAENDIPVMINIHQVELGKRYAQRIIGMRGGLVVYDGAPDGMEDEVLKKIYGGESWLAT
jgi:phosphonate transport system ATP-binding protein